MNEAEPVVLILSRADAHHLLTLARNGALLYPSAYRDKSDHVLSAFHQALYAEKEVTNGRT